MGFFARNRFLAAVDEANSQGCFVLPTLNAEMASRIVDLADSFHVPPVCIIVALMQRALIEFDDKAESGSGLTAHDRLRELAVGAQATMLVGCSSTASASTEFRRLFEQSLSMKR